MSALEGWRYCPRCASPVANDGKRISCESCGFVRYANAAPAVAAFLHQGDGRVLLARRAHEPAAGLWDTPGGFVEEDEEPLAALHRELAEETGLAIEADALVGTYVDRYGTAPDAPAVLNLVWEARIAGGRMRAADDVSELRWFALDSLPGDEELAFPWIGPALRAWAAGRG